jgi:hypothetical protein
MNINSCLITYPVVLILKVSKYCPLKLIMISDYDSLCDVRKKNTQKNRQNS